jgi:hypothetical protein
LLKHIDDDGDLSVFGGDAELVFVCKKCGVTWELQTSMKFEKTERVGKPDILSRGVFERLGEKPPFRQSLREEALRTYPEAFGHPSVE